MSEPRNFAVLSIGTNHWIFKHLTVSDVAEVLYILDQGIPARDQYNGAYSEETKPCDISLSVVRSDRIDWIISNEGIDKNNTDQNEPFISHRQRAENKSVK